VSLVGVRRVRVAGVYFPTLANRDALAAAANAHDLGPCQSFSSLEAMLESGEIDAIWLLNPTYARLVSMRAIHTARKPGRTSVYAIDCEKPLAGALVEAREMLALAEDARLLHSYLEDQVFSTAVQRGHDVILRRAVPSAGRPYIARAAEEHSGPHEARFWIAHRQVDGVLSDMMCHSVEVARFLFTAPGERRDALSLKFASGNIATLKSRRPEYAAKLKSARGGKVDYATRPAGDFTRGLLTFEDPDGNEIIVEATTSWAYVGPGPRLSIELLGSGYAMEYNSLTSGLKIFLSRAVTGSAGEDLVEKQSVEQGSMPVMEDEAGTYGYTAENRHMVESFRDRRAPVETFDDGVVLVEMLMALDCSAELGRTLSLPDPAVETYIPLAARRA